MITQAEQLSVPARLRRPLRLVTTMGRDMARCDLIKQASAMAYVTLLSLIPSLVAIFCVLSLFSPLLGDGDSMMDKARDFILDNLASDSGEQVVAYLDHMLSHISLASIGWSSFASVLVTLILLLRQIEEALNRIWLVPKGRNVFMRFMYFWTFLTLGVLVLGIVIGVVSGFNLHGLMAAQQTVQASPVGSFVGWLVAASGGFLFFFFLYKVVPNCFVSARYAAVGAGFAILLLNLAGRLYGVYVRDAKNYTTLYGALAQLPLFLTWLYICWVIILLGALLSWRLQEGMPHSKQDDTLDRARTPIEHMRNAQVRATLPLIALLAIYRHFLAGSGKGLSVQALAQTLKLPVAWVSQATDALQSLGYIVAGKQPGGLAAGSAVVVTDPFFPCLPAQTLTVDKLQADLASPLETWLGQWEHDLPLNLQQTLRLLATLPAQPRTGRVPANVAELLQQQALPV